jgi:hypothetical protein
LSKFISNAAGPQIEAKSAAVGWLLELIDDIVSNADPLGFAWPSSKDPGLDPVTNAAIYKTTTVYEAKLIANIYIK